MRVTAAVDEAKCMKPRRCKQRGSLDGSLGSSETVAPVKSLGEALFARLAFQPVKSAPVRFGNGYQTRYEIAQLVEFLA